MASTTVTVGSSIGLHARPAAVIADAAAKFTDDVILTLPDEETEGADAASTLMIMALGAVQGDQVTVTSSNARAVSEIADLIGRELGG